MDTEMIVAKLDDILRLDYGLYKVIKVCDKTIKVRRLKTERVKSDDREDFYGGYKLIPTNEFIICWATKSKYEERTIKKNQITKSMFEDFTTEIWAD
jgi:hypothetical protein